MSGVPNHRLPEINVNRMKKQILDDKQLRLIRRNGASLLEEINSLLAEKGLGQFVVADFSIVPKNSLLPGHARCCELGEEPRTTCDSSGRCMPSCVKC